MKPGDEIREMGDLPLMAHTLGEDWAKNAADPPTLKAIEDLELDLPPEDLSAVLAAHTPVQGSPIPALIAYLRQWQPGFATALCARRALEGC